MGRDGAFRDGVFPLNEGMLFLLREPVCGLSHSIIQTQHLLIIENLPFSCRMGGAGLKSKGLYPKKYSHCFTLLFGVLRGVGEFPLRPFKQSLCCSLWTV